MSSIDRQNRLLVAEDWKRIYQSYRNADFQSYDFENLRRTMIDYIRQNYPEDFNDYIESSEFLALIDLIAFVGQSIAFRVDLNARENFLELAERRDSVLRLARLISYNSKRNIPAQGLLKINTVQTTQNVIDSNGRNISNQVITWNDSSSTDWYDQFIKVLNAAFSSSQQFGSPSDKATIYGIPTEQYRIESSNTDVPIYSFTKVVSGRQMNFEITSTTFKDQAYIYEESPKLGNKVALIYRDDGKGAASSNTGFFFNFVQGVLNTGTFTITQPSTNESVDINSQNINNNDVWLYKLDQSGNEVEEWTKVPSVEGNNVIYNSINKNVRNIYGVSTRINDSVSLVFSDGTFGNVPLGTFRAYYRISNGLEYIINPQDIKNVIISIPYISNQNQEEVLTLSLTLTSSVINASATETNDSIKTNAPSNFYTQNRMISAEDYNVGPLSASQQVLKVRAVNRTSSGISRYLDLKDPTGKYSSTNLFATDGVIYRDVYNYQTRFQYTNKSDIEGIIYNTIFDLIKTQELKQFYYSQTLGLNVLTDSITWNATTSDVTYSTGSFKDVTSTVVQVGDYTNTVLKYIKPGALLKFVAPTGYYFNTKASNALVVGDPQLVLGATTYIWAEVASVVNDGTALGSGVLSTGFGPVALKNSVPLNAVLYEIIPKWQTSIESIVVTNIIDLIYANKPFGLRFDLTTQTWRVVFESDLDLVNPFSFTNAGNSSNNQLDASWLLLFTTDNEYYTVTSRNMRYVFESDTEIRFYYDKSIKIYDSKTSSVIKDKITMLSVNLVPDGIVPFTRDISWEISSEYNGLDGYVDTKKVILSFIDSDDNGVVDDPETFNVLVSPTVSPLNKYIVEEKYVITDGQEDYRYVDNSSDIVLIMSTETDIELSTYSEGQYFYFVDKNVVKKLVNQTLLPTLDYKVYVGRDKLKFQYIHNADSESRIDPGMSNIIDVYILSKGYDTLFRQWLNGANISQPLPPSSDELYDIVSPSLNLVKSISDEIIYHPVNYKVLFGQVAQPELQATFKVTKTQGRVVSDNDIKSRVISAINEFFALENWDFGDTFYFTEMSTYVMNKLAPDISNFVIVPKQSGYYFGSLFEIKSSSDQLFINGATVDDIEIIQGITTSNIKAVSGTSIVSNIISQQVITSAVYGDTNV